ncbi:hypothetical protein [Winogradskyella helgolandensis]|uniref:hypothetical protein n=1 Tax=Winogradskyella helgolandensis TaxID=2697010 RepID=UPI0015C6F0FE|nr:hypothetical protein [Winogradskyella helgolandensis]
MEAIKILFFVVGTFFGMNQSNIISEKTTVTVNPEEKTIVILQENLVTFIKTQSDSLNIKNELSKIVHPNHSWSSELKNFPVKEKEFYMSDDHKSLHLKLSLTYSTLKDLKVFGIHMNNDGKFSMTNFPKSHTKSKDGILEDPYWNFEADRPFTFTEEPLTDLPEAFQKLKTNLLPFWLALK